MCKFTNRLFVFALLGYICLNVAIVDCAATVLPAAHLTGGRSEAISILDVLKPDYDYDLHYDQRQKGMENVRLKLDGFFVGVPGPDTSDASYTEDLLESLTEELLLGALGKSQTIHAGAAVGENFKPDSTVAAQLSPAEDKRTAILVEIPAPKRQLEGRNRGDQLLPVDEYPNWSRTRYHINSLLNLMKRTRGY